MQYEIYDQNSKDKLNTLTFKNTTIDLYIPTTLEKQIQNLYEDLKKYGYDLFDINGEFYQDICATFKSEKGTDVLLSDRIKDYYTNKVLCQSNCKFIQYNITEQSLKCQCQIYDYNIDFKKFDKYNEEFIAETLYKSQKNSNFKSMKCTNLIFSGKSFSKNAGCILMFLYFLSYLVFVIIYIIQRLNPLKIHKIKELLEIDDNNDINHNITIKYNENENNNENSIENNTIKDSKNNLNSKVNEKVNNLIIDQNNNDKNKEILSNPPKKERNSISVEENSNNNINSIKNNTIKDSSEFIKIKNNNKINSEKTHKRSIKNRKNPEEKVNPLNVDSIGLFNEQEGKLSDLELNMLGYKEAQELDKRSFLRIYWSIIKREIIILLLTFSRKDYNLLNCKLARLVFILSSYLGMNVIFFSDNSIHKVYLNNGKYNFGNQISQIIYSIIINKVLEIFICYATLTDKYIYKIMGFKINLRQKNNTIKIFKCINIKIIVYFCISFSLIIFYWYLVTSFCAVYENIQTILITNYFLSLLFSLLYSFVLYLLPAGLRIMALKNIIKKYSELIYKISILIPIF